MQQITKGVFRQKWPETLKALRQIRGSLTAKQYKGFQKQNSKGKKTEIKVHESKKKKKNCGHRVSDYRG